MHTAVKATETVLNRTSMARKVSRWLEQTQERAHLAHFVRTSVKKAGLSFTSSTTPVAGTVHFGALRLSMGRIEDEESSGFFLLGREIRAGAVRDEEVTFFFQQPTHDELRNGSWASQSALEDGLMRPPTESLACIMRYGLPTLFAVAGLFLHLDDDVQGGFDRLLPLRYETALERMVVPFHGTSLTAATEGCARPKPDFPTPPRQPPPLRRRAGAKRRRPAEGQEMNN